MSSRIRRRNRSLVKLEKITVWLSSYYYELIADKAEENEIPVMRQFQALVDNAVNILGDDAFTVDTSFNEVIEEFQYADEAGKILNYIKQIKNPIGLDTLLYTRHDIGIEDREDFLGGFTELMNSKLIKPIPKVYKEGQRVYKGYRVYVPVEDESKSKIFDKDKEIRKLKDKLKKLEDLHEG